MLLSFFLMFMFHTNLNLSNLFRVCVCVTVSNAPISGHIVRLLPSLPLHLRYTDSLHAAVHSG